MSSWVEKNENGMGWRGFIRAQGPEVGHDNHRFATVCPRGPQRPLFLTGNKPERVRTPIPLQP
jgi:hypothetical protein